MAANLTEDYVYAYRFASHFDHDALRLAASGGITESLDDDRATEPQTGEFFAGKLKQPREVAIMLRTLSQIVRTHFFDARPPQMDPIVTSSSSLVRWEGFSGCCGAYARLDLNKSAFDVHQQKFGTTNVDFNPTFIANLASVGSADDVRLSIDSESLRLSRNAEPVEEKRVTLPRRWVRGLCEVQVYQSRLELRHRFTPGLISPLLHSAARNAAGQQFLTVAGGRPRLAPRDSTGAIAVGGIGRLEALRTLLPVVREVSLYGDAESGVHAWVGETEWSRFWLVLSPTLQRGFSGEGQVLQTLADGTWQSRIATVRALLADSPNRAASETIDPAEIATRLGCSVRDAYGALAALATNGLAGFDAATGYYFQRQLPFDVNQVPRDQSRLRAAQKLVEDSAVHVVEQLSEDEADLEVVSGDTIYYVRLRREGNRCTCPWFSKHQGQRGPCKHVLAARAAFQKGPRHEH